MKFNWLILIFFLIIISAFNISYTFEMNNPSVKIIYEKFETNKRSGDIIVFSVKLCSSNYLQTFSILPDIPGLNEDSELKYIFNGKSKQATVNYFYIVPKNIDNIKKISFEFVLQDSNNKIIKEKNISIK